MFLIPFRYHTDIIKLPFCVRHSFASLNRHVGDVYKRLRRCKIPCAKGCPFETLIRLRLYDWNAMNASKAKRETVLVSYRLDKNSHEVLNNRAAAAGISARRWIESAILANKTQIIARQKPHPDLRALLFQVSRAGNNLNQIAHRLNSLHVSGALNAADADVALQAIDHIGVYLKKALDHAG